MAIPENITKEDVLQAIVQIDRESEIPWHRESTTYDVEHSGKHYPPKYVVSVANKVRNGKELDDEDFNSIEARAFLEKEGFKIVTKEDGGDETMVENQSSNNLEKKDIDEKYDSFVKQGKITFVTFHPSLSYEEFIEGITFGTNSDDKYIKKEGLFKMACSRALSLALEAKKVNDHKYVPEEDYSLSGTWKRLYEKYCTYVADDKNKKKEFWEDADVKDNRVVFIIDEINRGDIAKIFGELITLIEEDKRLGGKNEQSATLPISRDKFAVPMNLYIIGTMNTADRSLVQLDVALRRRFQFKAMWPILEEAGADKQLKRALQEHEKTAAFLRDLNRRILDDKEYPDLGPDKLIGHAYLFELDNMPPKDWLEKKIIPLVYEYTNGIKEKFWKLLFGQEITEQDYAEWYKFDVLAGKILQDHHLADKEGTNER